MIEKNIQQRPKMSKSIFRFFIGKKYAMKLLK